MDSRDHLGKRGEEIAKLHLSAFCGNPLPYFDPHFLGDKCAAYDLLVELVDAGPSPAYFFAQIKSTRSKRQNGRLQVALSMRDVRKMVECPVSTYLIGVDEPSEEAFLVSVHGNQTKGFSSITTEHPLNPENLKRLRDEVEAHWKSLNKTRSSTFKRGGEL